MILLKTMVGGKALIGVPLPPELAEPWVAIVMPVEAALIAPLWFVKFAALPVSIT